MASKYSQAQLAAFYAKGLRFLSSTDEVHADFGSAAKASGRPRDVVYVIRKDGSMALYARGGKHFYDFGLNRDTQPPQDTDE